MKLMRNGTQGNTVRRKNAESTYQIRATPAEDLPRTSRLCKQGLDSRRHVPDGFRRHYPEEAPAHEVTVDGFWIDVHTVTNEEFRRFVEATKYVTSAERSPNPDDYPGAKPELLVPASAVFQKPKQRVDLSDCYQWWTYVPGANWCHPEGPSSTLKRKSETSRRPTRLRRRRSLRQVDRQGIANGSGVGVCCSRRIGRS